MEMKTFYWVSMILYFQKLFITRALKDIIQDLNVHHVTVFTNYAENENSSIFLQNITASVPTVLINLYKMKLTANNRTLEMPFFKNPRPSTIYIFLQEKRTASSDTLKINSVLSQLVEVSPISMRPKCLVVFSQTGNLLFNDAKNILDYAWSLKFLDFTILKVESYSKSIAFINYNPFKKRFDAGYIKNKNDIFPDKLIDVEKYPLIIPVFDMPPILTLKTQNNIVISVVDLPTYSYVKSVSEKLNFELHFKYYSGSLEVAYTRAGFSVVKGETNVTPIAWYHSNEIILAGTCIGRIMKISKMVIVVPVLTEYIMNIPFEAFVYVVSFVLIVAIFSISMRVLRLKSKLTGVTNLLQVLIGMVTTQPTKNAERIIFLTLATLSIFYTSDFFSTLADIKVSGKEKEFNTYEDIKESKIPVYTVWTIKDNIEEFEENILNTYPISSYSACIKKLIFTRNIICIMDVRTATYAVNGNLNAEGKPLMKITELSMVPAFVGFSYEKGSPFVEKFDKMMLHMMEFAVFSNREKYIVKLHSLKEESSGIDETVMKTAVSILFIGLLASTVAFIYELLYFLKNNKIKSKKAYKGMTRHLGHFLANFRKIFAQSH